MWCEMKVKLWIDLPDGQKYGYAEEENLFATGKPLSNKMDGYTRYLIEVDLPVKHFKPVADRKIEAVVIGKEEE